MEKYPKEVELLESDLEDLISVTPWQVYYEHSLKDSIHPTHSLQVAMKVLFLDILQVPLGYIWSPPSRNLIHSFFILT